MSTKQSLKQIQKQIKDGELEGALHNATTLLKGLKKDEPDAASVYVTRTQIRDASDVHTSKTKRNVADRQGCAIEGWLCHIFSEMRKVKR